MMTRNQVRARYNSKENRITYYLNFKCPGINRMWYKQVSSTPFCCALVHTIIFFPVGTDAVTTVTGHRGRSVQIKCSYESGYEENEKYLCRGKCPLVGYKDIPVRSGSPAEDPRFSLYDDTTAKVFIVTITDLRPEDRRPYWCAIKRTLHDSYTEIQLLVKTGECYTEEIKRNLSH